MKIQNNVFDNCLKEAIKGTGIHDVTISGNTFRNIKGSVAIQMIDSSTNVRVISDNLFINMEHAAINLAGLVTIKDCVFNGIGTTETPLTDRSCAISKYAGNMTVSGCVLKDARIYSSATQTGGLAGGIQNADCIENTDIELVLNGVTNAGGDAIKGSATKRIIGGKLGGRVAVSQPNAIVQGLVIESTNIGNDALIINAKGVAVTGCVISTNSNYAIAEGTNADYNLIANNVCKRPIKAKVGANTVITNNVTGVVTA